MIAIQFQSLQESEEEVQVRDTRDVRELREQLKQSQDRRIQLSNEIDKLNQLAVEYEETLTNRDNVSGVLENQINELKEIASLSEINGDGVIIRIESLVDEEFLQVDDFTPPVELFRFLLNEVRSFGGSEIAVGTERVLTTSAFRDVNGVPQLNYKRVQPLPLDIFVISDDPEKLHNELLVSASVEEFEAFGYALTFQMEENMTLPSYEQIPRVRFMEETKGD